MFSDRSACRSRLAACVLCLGVSGPLLAGDLNPPAGPVAPTAKPLTELEPRRLINLTNTPGDADSLYRISQPGSYYLGANVIGVSGKSGIEIAAAPVTIDLNGYTLTGVPGSSVGIVVSGPLTGPVSVFNGQVTAWGSYGLNLQGVNGGRVENVTAYSNANTGFIAAENMIVKQCESIDNGGSGFILPMGGALINSLARGNSVAGIALTNARAEGCVAIANNNVGFSITSSALMGCSAVDNTATGILALANSHIESCTSAGNSADGISASGHVRSCIAASNSATGIVVSNATVSDCTVRSNGNHGITASASSIIIGNNCSGNGTVWPTGAGIRVTGDGCRIESNNLHGNDIGIQITAQVNLVIGNTCRANSVNNFDIVANNRVGPIVVPPLSGLITGNSGAAGVGTADPWANLAY